jgi:hypothetical protein
VEGQRPGTGQSGARRMNAKNVSRTLEDSAEELRRVHDEFRAVRTVGAVRTCTAFATIQLRRPTAIA